MHNNFNCKSSKKTSCNYLKHVYKLIIPNYLLNDQCNFPNQLQHLIPVKCPSQNCAAARGMSRILLKVNRQYIVKVIELSFAAEKLLIAPIIKVVQIV